MCPRRRSVAAVWGVSGMASAGAVAQPAFYDIGLPPNGNSSALTAVSGDGNVAAGQLVLQGTGHAIRWTSQAGLIDMGTFPGGTNAAALAISGTGAVIVGTGSTSQGTRAWRWAGGSIVSLGLLPGLPSNSNADAMGVSSDGNVVVGRVGPGAEQHGFRWTPSGGMVDIGIYPGGTQSVQVSGVSRDGAVLVGVASMAPNSGGRAFRWQAGVMQDLGALPGPNVSEATATDQNGSMVVGYSYSTPTRIHPFRWTAAGGMVDLGLLPGHTNGGANCISGDSSVIGGTTDDPLVNGSRRAFIWTASRGMQNLHTLVQSLGVNLDGWTLDGLRGISDDGTVLVGAMSRPNTNPHGWVLDLRADSDGDGLRDDWEINGIPYVDAGGAARRYVLPGANPAHKDLYVEVDLMAGISVDQNAIDMVVQAFVDSPMVNPDGVTGVTLHVQIDEGDLPYIAQWHTNGCWPDSFDLAYIAAHFGTAAERADPAGVPLRVAKQKAYRYGVLADRADPSIGGCGKIGGDWFVVFTGGAGPSADHQATAFMHEFGHNLGLKHGGGDHTNGKPNYPSIMNYVTAYKAPWNEGFWRLDYSRVGPEGFATLNEVELDETAGIGTLLGPYHDWVMPFGVNVAAGGPRAVRYALLNGSPIDFGSPNGNGVPDGQYGTGIIQDLNYVASPPAGVNLPSGESGGDVLEAYNDWEHVVLAPYGARGPSAPLPIDPTGELTIAARDWMAQNFPPPGGGPPACYANCDGSTVPPVLNVLDFNCFLNAFAAGAGYANCDGSTVPPVLNVLDFNCFLNRFAAGCP